MEFPNCRHEVPNNSNFCVHCGHKRSPSTALKNKAKRSLNDIVKIHPSLPIHELVSNALNYIRRVRYHTIRAIFILLLFSLPSTLYAEKGTYVLTEEKSVYEIEQHVEILEDKDKEWTIDHVSSPEFDTKFHKLNQKKINFGFSDSRYWFRVKIRNDSKENKFILEIANYLLDKVTVFVFLNNRLVKKEEIGRGLLTKDRKQKHNHLLATLDLKSNEPITIVIQIENSDMVIVPMKLYKIERFINFDHDRNSITCVLIGIPLTVLIYNFILFLFVRDYSYLWFALSLFSCWVYSIGETGYAYVYVWGNYPNIFVWSDVFWASIGTLFMMVFYLEFTQLAHHSRWLVKFRAIFVWLLSLTALLTMIVPLKIIVPIVSLISISTTIGILIFSFLYKKKQAIYIKLFLISFLPSLIIHLLAAVSYYIYSVIAIPVDLFVFSTAFIAISFSIALSYRYKLLITEKIAVQNEARITLEQKVYERTNELEERNEILQGIKNKLKKYLPKQLVENITSGDHSIEPKTERRKMTFFFSDIKDFTKITDALEPEDMVNILNEYLTEMNDIIDKYEGTLAQVIGDGLYVFFGSPKSTGDKDNALRCLKMAIEMQKKMNELNKKWFDAGVDEEFQIRCGINTGMATVGGYGSTERKEYTAMGMQVNIAARIEAACKPGNIFLSHTTRSLVKDIIACKDLGKVKLKGYHKPIKIYQVENIQV